MAARSTAIQPSFNAGELSPRLHGRVDQAVYGIGCETMTGWIPLIQGCALAAPGTHYVEDAAGPCRLIPFEYSPTQAYAIEASDALFRFYTNDARIDVSPGTPYEVASPYSYEEALALDYQQSRDVLYLAGAGRQQRKLSRTGAETFSIAALELRNGPIGDSNADEDRMILASGVTGSVTLTSSLPIFAATDVGRLIEVEAADYNDVPSWEPGLTIASGQKRTWAGKVYVYNGGGGGRTGTAPPIHDAGTEWDGDGTGTDVNSNGPYGVPWTFLHGRYGLARITGFTADDEVTVEVLKRFADSLTSNPSWRWAFGAFSDTSGWPDVVVEWNETIVWLKGSTGYVSVVGDLEKHERRDSSGDFQRDLAGRFTIPGGGTAKWGVADRLLLIGTDTGEYTVERLLVQTGEPGPPIFEVKKQTKHGSKAVKPVEAGGPLLFVQKAGRKLLQMDYEALRDRYAAPDQTRLADHMPVSGFTALAWQAEPERLVWGVLGDGTIASMTYDPDQQVMGWWRRVLGGGMLARSICCITDPDGRLPQLWLAVEDGAAWRVLRMHKLWEHGDVQADAFMVDAGLSHDGAAAKTFGGLAHLEGRTVQVLADGKPHPDRTVSGGSVAIDYPASKVHIGLAYPAILKTLRIEAPAEAGTSQGRMKRIVAMTLRLLDALGLRYSVQGGPPVAIEHRVAGMATNTAVPLQTGDVALNTIGSYDRDGQITIERFQPLPATLVAVIPTVKVGDK